MDNKGNILIVDDDMGICETLSDIMEIKGYQTAIALDGYEAIQKVKDVGFDVILMDIKMPGINGVETFKQIKRIRPETSVVMMTAYAVEDLIGEALREGAYGVLYKPFDMQQMIGLLEGIRGGGFVLVVDDDPNTRVTFKEVLEAKGYEVGTASNGEEAIKMAGESDYDMIFIDMKLPTINGLQTYMAIREVNPEVVAVMMTAYRREMGELVDQALKEDAYTCLYKPFDVEKTITLVGEICRTKRQKRGE
jgi:two-component system response regulator HydG